MIILLQKPVPGLFIFFVNFDENLKKFQKNLKFKNSVKIEEIGFFKKTTTISLDLGQFPMRNKFPWPYHHYFTSKMKFQKIWDFDFLEKIQKIRKKSQKIDFAKIQKICI